MAIGDAAPSPGMAIFLAGLVGGALILAVACDENDSAASDSTPARKRAESLRQNAESFFDETSESIESHQPDTGLELSPPASPE